MSHDSSRVHAHVNWIVGLVAMLALPALRAQQVTAPAPSSAALAKYDRNHNGVLDADELAAMEADQRKTIPLETPAGADRAGREDPTVLSPFEVVESSKGYYSANTMSGTRFNTKIEDLASSISVVTKEQMADFAMLDINDVFAYTANTEGTHDFTDYEIDANGSVSDNVQLNPTGANRVRGMMAANISMGNTEMMGRTPVDPLGIDAIEISRGPNSTVFGLGSPAGTLNMVASSANLSRNRAQTTLRGDSLDGYRTSLDINRVLLRDKLAIRASGAYQHDGFFNKPSGVDSVRYIGMVKYQPFKRTTISGSYQLYRMWGNRPNVSPPRDNVSYWIASGRPGWDPVRRTVTVNGRTTAPLLTDTAIPDYFNRTVVSGTNHAWVWVDENGNIQHWEPRASTGLSSPNNTQTPTYVHTSAGSYNSGVASGGQAALQTITQPLFSTAPSVSDRAVYDYTAGINLYAMNWLRDKTETTNIRVDQIVFDTRRQSLAAQLNFQREDAERYERNLFGAANSVGASGQLLVDPNLTYLDGTPNPFFGRPFLNTGAPRTFRKPSLWDSYRGQLAYKLDLRRENNWLHWLGLHQVTGYDEYKYRVSRQYTYRDAIVDNHSWIPAGRSRGNQSAIAGGATQSLLVTRVDGRYYVGDAVGSGVDYAPKPYKYGTYTFTWGDANLGVFNREPAQLGEAAVTDQTGGGNNTKSILKTEGGVIQSHFLDSRLVTTFGLRRDQTYAKSGFTPQNLLPDGISFDYDTIDHWAVGDWRHNVGRTKTSGAVVRPFRDLPMVRRLGEGTGAAHLLGEILNGLSLTYNRADSFRPQTPAQNLFFGPLENSTGVGKDYGFWLTLFDEKMVLRVNRYENSQLSARFGTATSLIGRTLNIDVTGTAGYRLTNKIREWTTELHPSWSESQIQDEIVRVSGLSAATQEELLNPKVPFAATQDLKAKGTEVELYLNPTRFWTVSASVTEKQSINSNLGSELSQWIGQRMKVWTAVVDPRTNTPWFTNKYGSAQSAYDNFAIAVQTPLDILLQKQGKADPQVRRYNAKLNTNFRLAGITDEPILKRFNVGGSARFESRGGIGYYGKQQLPAVITELDPNRVIYDKAHYYFDAFVGYRTKLWADKVGATFQFNVRNLQQGRAALRPVGAFPDGTPLNYRIIEPRQFILQATFDL